MTLDPASAVAAAKCLASRIWINAPRSLGDVSAFHPRPCAWEDWTKDDLVRLLDDFNQQAGYEANSDRYASIPIERFRALPRAEQARLVQLAQYPIVEEAA